MRWHDHQPRVLELRECGEIHVRTEQNRKPVKTDAGRARGAREWRSRDPVSRAQETGLRGDPETDRRTSCLHPPALQRGAGSPSSLGKPGPRAQRSTGSDVGPEAFPHRSPGEGAGSRGRLGSCQGGSVLGVAGGPLAWDIPIGNTRPPSVGS